MKISYCSDLHLEFRPILLENTDNSDILILAGDIALAEKTQSIKGFYEFFQSVSEQWKDIILVLGNHEHYKGNFLKTYSLYREALLEFANITLLDNAVLDIADIRFIGCTLWTSFDGGDPLVKELCRQYMSDFRVIRTIGYRKFTPNDAELEHHKSVKFIKSKLDHDKIILVTHHAPSLQCIPELYKHSQLNGAYVSDLDYLFYDNPQIKYSIYGHNHTKADIQINETRLLCNPRGYPDEKVFRDFRLETFELN